MAKTKAEDTPLMQQHRAIKQRYPDAILLFRVGDFYETFGQDAVTASGVLGITLTKRNNGAAASLDLAGFPHHSLDTYLHKLVRAGHRVAICDQLEDPKTVKGIVKRGVTEMVTPGTATQDKLLEHKNNNFLAGIYLAPDQDYGLCFLDISTGEFLIAQGDREYADKLLQSFKPVEVIFQRQYQKKIKEELGIKTYSYALDEWVFAQNFAEELLLKQFQTHSFKGFGIADLDKGLVAAGAVMHYLKDTEHPNLQHITSIQRIDKKDFLWMDRFTIRNLELVTKNHENSYTLLDVLDHTVSPMGARLLKRWVIFPLINRQKIEERLGLVQFFILQTELRAKMATAIHQCGDLERIVAKIPLRKINPREVLQLGRALREINTLRELGLSGTNELLTRLALTLDPCQEIADKIFQQITENPPALASKGGMINEKVNAELDELRQIAHHGKEYLARLQQREADATGITSLKIAFNSVFGYYLEVTNVHKNKVPDHWMRKQTLANAERYITPELKEYEEKITGAEEKIFQIESQVYEALQQDLSAFIPAIQTNCHVIAQLDCLLCFADNAMRFNYRRPELHDGYELHIEEGRHPVIERYLPAGDAFITNDLDLNKTDQQIIILTGPNMSGKSALLRQTGLITLMAHMGSFVPATQARIPVTDKIFTRVGAADNLSGGESTFMVEMNETASIVNTTTDRSLILLDEIGRGTSTYDGISIAWSIAEYLHHLPQQPLTLFATHYHELNELEQRWPRIKNYHITNREIANKIVFLRKLARGGSTHSFGIHVAKMAGMPASLITRANELLLQLESKHLDQSNQQALQQTPAPQVQLSIFDAHTEVFEEIRKMLEVIDINTLTPIDALLKLQEIRNRLK